jgi:bifunctional ADP-heptose synthase (sugar kinase/adenylyltransferase)
VDMVVKFSTNEELHEWVAYFKPDLLVKGSDWRGNVVGSDICKVEYFNIDPRFSTTRIIEKVLSKHFDIMESFYGSEDSGNR